jgi:DnaJ-class molecular chaperone
MLGQRGWSRDRSPPVPGLCRDRSAGQPDRPGGVTIRQVAACPDCRGRGSIIDDPCPDCQGAGRTAEQGTVTIRIPPASPRRPCCGWLAGSTPSPAVGGEPGDAHAIIRAEAGPRFTRAGADLRHDLNFTVPEP